MKTKIMKAIALCLALALCFGSAISVSAAEVADASIDESQKGSLTIFKYDLAAKMPVSGTAPMSPPALPMKAVSTKP